MEDILKEHRSIKKVNRNTSIMKNQPKQERQVGFCRNSIHTGAISSKMLKQHKCIEKNCMYFVKYKHSTYWKQQDTKKLVNKILKTMNKNGWRRIEVKGNVFLNPDRHKLYSIIAKFDIHSIDDIKFRD